MPWSKSAYGDLINVHYVEKDGSYLENNHLLEGLGNSCSSKIFSLVINTVAPCDAIPVKEWKSE